MQKILLGLSGKRITFAKTVEDHDGSFDWVSVAYVNSDTRSYLLIDYDEAVLNQAKAPYSYYDNRNKAIKQMSAIPASVTKTSIENDGVDGTVYTVKTSEPMDVIVQQEIGTIRENGVFPLTPVNGIIEITINSDCIGTIRVSAVGDTKYAEAIEISVV